jgi:predicted XRE-type DNA-binding protein
VTAKAKSAYQELNYANADEMLIKARLVTEISDQMKRRELTQAEASVSLGFSQPKLSNLLRRQFRGVSEKKLMERLAELGWNVVTVVRAAPRSRREGRTAVAVLSRKSEFGEAMLERKGAPVNETTTILMIGSSRPGKRRGVTPRWRKSSSVEKFA